MIWQNVSDVISQEMAAKCCYLVAIFPNMTSDWQIKNFQWGPFFVFVGNIWTGGVPISSHYVFLALTWDRISSIRSTCHQGPYSLALIVTLTVLTVWDNLISGSIWVDTWLTVTFLNVPSWLIYFYCVQGSGLLCQLTCILTWIYKVVSYSKNCQVRYECKRIGTLMAGWCWPWHYLNAKLSTWCWLDFLNL